MTQQTINLGAGPDSQTGDTLYTAFAKTNENFTELYSVFGANGITTINANVIHSNTVIASANIRAGNLFSYGNIETIGYVVTAGAFYPNGTPIGSLSSIASNLIPETSNVFTIGSSTRQFTQGYFSTNLTLAGANVTVVDNQILINGQIAGNFGNANIAAYLPSYNGNLNSINSLTANTGNTIYDFTVGGNLFVGGNITYQNVETGNLEVANAIIATGNITAQYFLGNGRYLSGIDATSIQNGTSNVKVYSNSNVNITTAGSNTWVFDNFGNLTLPSGGKIGDIYNDDQGTGIQAGPVNNSYAIIASSDLKQYVQADNNAVYIGTSWSANNYNWTFGTDGSLTLPANGNISPVSGYMTLGQGLLVGAGGSLFNANNQTWGLYGQTVDPGTVIELPGLVDSEGGRPLLIRHDYAAVNIQSAGGTWAFGNTGILTFPDGTQNYGSIVIAPDDYDIQSIANTYIQTSAAAGAKTWTFDTTGNLAAPGNITTAANIAASYFIGNFVGNISGNISAAGANTQVLFNDSGTVNGSSGLTFNKDSNLVIVGGTLSATQVNVAGYNVIDSTGNIVTSQLVNSGVVEGTYGNASSVPSITVDNKGRVTAVSNVAVAGVSNVSYDTTTGNLTVSTSSGTNYVVDLGVGTADSPIFSGLSVAGNTTVSALTVNANATIGGTLGVTGNLVAGNLSATNFVGNAITLGTNTAGQLASNAVTLTSATSITNSIAQLNYVLGKLVPTAPNNFPGGQTLTISTLSSYRMTNFVQTDNTATGSKSVAGGTLVSNVRRANTYTTSTIANVGPGDSGIVTSYRNGVGVGNVTLIAGNVSGTYGNLIITRSGDYANVSNVTPGFWYSFSSSLSGTVPSGWNEVYIGDSATGNTNIPYWYYDASTPGTPTWSNTSIALTTNSSTYSSTIPHLNSSSQFTLYGNVSKLSGDMFPSGASSSAYAFITGTAGGAFAAPASVTYAQANVTWPLAQNLYVSSGSAYLTTTAAVTTGFGSSATGPSLTADNSYLTGASAFAPGVTVLYKTGTSTQIEETSIVVTSVGTGSGNALRVVNPGSTNTPAITANTAFNSQSATLQTYDTTVVAAVLKHDQTNYSTGYLPVGPNLSTGRTGDQYFTFKFTRTVVSKFDISVTGNVAGCWVALPGSSIDTTSSLNGWIDMSTAYAGSGIPGANIGAGGNGSNGCALGGTFTTNSSVTQSKTCTFGTVSSSSTVSNEIFVRLRLVAGQTVTALSIVTATH